MASENTGSSIGPHRRRNRPQKQKQPASSVQSVAEFSTSMPALAPNASMGSTKTFQSFVDSQVLSAETISGLEYPTCSEIQEKTMVPIIEGKDILARARTGTGKTLAFLVPSIERHITRSQTNTNIPILVLSPTRELAQQIAKESQRIRVNGRSLTVEVLIGGTNVNSEVRRINKGHVDVIAATPGRLVDHLENYGLADKLKDMKSFILDEADRLLDQGFERDLKKIIARLPKREVTPRQTLLFSATISPEIMQVAKNALKTDYLLVDTVGNDEEATHEHIPQYSAVVPNEHLYSASTALLLKELENAPDGKIIAFFPSAKEVTAFHTIFSGMLAADKAVKPISSYALHSRKSQSQRTRELAAFTQSTRSVLFCTDVVARGIDIPEISCVYQIGPPMDAEQYVHRVGRTGRAGKDGHAVFVLPENQSSLLRFKGFRDLKISSIGPSNPLNAALLPENLNAKAAALKVACRLIQSEIGSIYASWTGAYRGMKKYMGWTDADLVEAARVYAVDVLGYRADNGSDEPPPIDLSLVKKMGLVGSKDSLVIQKKQPRERNDAPRFRDTEDRHERSSERRRDPARPAQRRAMGA